MGKTPKTQLVQSLRKDFLSAMEKRRKLKAKTNKAYEELVARETPLFNQELEGWISERVEENIQGAIAAARKSAKNGDHVVFFSVQEPKIFVNTRGLPCAPAKWQQTNLLKTAVAKKLEELGFSVEDRANLELMIDGWAD